jgi:hypothetical protein
MPSVLPSSVADAKLAEQKAWRRYAEARDNDWREALAEWVEARDALLAAYAEEAASRTNFDMRIDSAGQTTAGPADSFAKHPPRVLDPHFVGDACSREPHELGERRVGPAGAAGQSGNKASHGGVAMSIERAEVY